MSEAKRAAEIPGVPEHEKQSDSKKTCKDTKDSAFLFDEYGHKTERGQNVDEYMQKTRDHNRV